MIICSFHVGQTLFNTWMPEKMTAIWQTLFSNAFLELNVSHFVSNFAESFFFPEGSRDSKSMMVWVMAWQQKADRPLPTVYPKKYAHGYCFAVLCCGYSMTDFPISIRLTSLALWQSNDCPSASKATLMNMDKYFMWIHYERLRNHNKAKHNKTVCLLLGIYCISK